MSERMVWYANDDSSDKSVLRLLETELIYAKRSIKDIEYIKELESMIEEYKSILTAEAL